MKNKAIVLFLIIFCWFSFIHAEDCSKYKGKVRRSHEWFFGLDYPYWFSLGQLEVESNCLWMTSLDGWGSIGPAQITPKFWDAELKELFPNWKVKDHADYFMAQAYILAQAHKDNPCDKLFITYQCYNRSCRKIVRECFPECKWEAGYQKCMQRPEQICVWKVKDQCKQYRTSCDINYSYGRKVYQNGKKYEDFQTKRWSYW